MNDGMEGKGMGRGRKGCGGAMLACAVAINFLATHSQTEIETSFFVPPFVRLLFLILVIPTTHRYSGA